MMRCSFSSFFNSVSSNAKMPTISVIIPAYNGVARYLEQAIHSVLAQTYRDIELIVVDDASTDDTARLVLRFPTARYFRRAENGGQAAARNDEIGRASCRERV